MSFFAKTSERHLQALADGSEDITGAFPSSMTAVVSCVGGYGQITQPFFNLQEKEGNEAAGL